MRRCIPGHAFERVMHPFFNVIDIFLRCVDHRWQGENKGSGQLIGFSFSAAYRSIHVTLSPRLKHNAGRSSNRLSQLYVLCKTYITCTKLKTDEEIYSWSKQASISVGFYTRSKYKRRSAQRTEHKTIYIARYL